MKREKEEGTVIKLSLEHYFGMLFIGCLMGYMAWDQLYFWNHYDGYSFGYFTPVFAVYALYYRFPFVVKNWTTQYRSGEEQVANYQILRVLFFISFFVGIGLLVLGSLVRAGVGPFQSASILITLGSLGVVFSLVYFLSKGATRERFWVLKSFVFPFCIWFVSIPLFLPFAKGIKGYLMLKVSTLVYIFYEVLGFAIRKEGSVLVLLNGSVGVEEACSGIRSLVAVIFVGFFLGAIRLKKLFDKWLLVIAAILLAFMGNVFRTAFLTGWVIRYGPGSISGWVHEGAGWSVLVLTFTGLLLILRLLGKQEG